MEIKGINKMLKRYLNLIFYFLILIFLVMAMEFIYVGKHNIDLGYNFKGDGVMDMGEDFEIRPLEDYYIEGFKQVRIGTFILLLEIIALIIYSLKERIR